MRRDDPADELPADYDRPNHAWTCGLAADGRPCPVGPTSRGGCPSALECAPVRDGDRWVCNRSDLRGGPCDEVGADGPTPDGRCCLSHTCRPRRTLRSLRGRWLAGAAALTIGVVLTLFGSAERNAVLVPGPLTSHHAQVLAGAETEKRCAACHPGSNGSTLSLVAAGVLGTGAAKTPQADACLHCHTDLAATGADPLGAHGLPPEAPALLRSPLTGANPPNAAAHGGPAELACAVCHQEHRGSDHNLNAISDGRCQACHTEQYTGFAEDHPDFGDWPYERRTRIAFNHASHATLHFDKAGKPFDCRACHLEDATGDLTARADYATSCAECHEADLKKSFADGVALVALPTLDDAALAEAGATLRGWPDAATGEFDGEPPPLTKLLLAADPAARDALRRLGEDFSFFDVDPDSPEQVAAAAEIVAALRALLDELQEEGHANLDYRLRRLTTAERAPLADFVARLPVELVDQLQARWFTDSEGPLPDFDAVEDRRTGGGWLLDEPAFALRYRPTGHDDPFLRAWIDLITALPAEHAELREACLAEFARPGAPGGCLECHSVDRDAHGDPTVHWQGRDRLAAPRAFTFFSHRPHLTQPQLADCTHCHQLDPSADLRAKYTGGDPHRFRSEFVSLGKAACVECHRPHAAGAHCTQCHHYHVAPQRNVADSWSELPTVFDPRAGDVVGVVQPADHGVGPQQR